MAAAVLCGLSKADEAERVRVAIETTKVLLTQVKAKSCNCADTGVCLCDPKDCKCGPACVQHCTEKALCCKTYQEARAKAVASSKRLVVWVGGVCLPCVRELTDYLHVQVEDGYLGFRSGAVLAEGRDGECYRVQTWEGEFPTVAELRAAREVVRTPRAYQFSEFQPQYFAPPLQFYAPPPMFYGGFRGGCAGGRCR